MLTNKKRKKESTYGKGPFKENICLTVEWWYRIFDNWYILNWLTSLLRSLELQRFQKHGEHTPFLFKRSNFNKIHSVVMFYHLDVVQALLFYCDFSLDQPPPILQSQIHCGNQHHLGTLLKRRKTGKCQCSLVQ